MSNGRPWLPSHTALMAYYVGKGWPDWRIARKLGFTRQTVQARRSTMGWSNPPGPLAEGVRIYGGPISDAASAILMELVPRIYS